jgi:hypothetical protein
MTLSTIERIIIDTGLNATHFQEKYDIWITGLFKKQNVVTKGLIVLFGLGLMYWCILDFTLWMLLNDWKLKRCGHEIVSNWKMTKLPSLQTEGYIPT